MKFSDQEQKGINQAVFVAPTTFTAREILFQVWGLDPYEPHIALPKTAADAFERYIARTQIAVPTNRIRKNSGRLYVKNVKNMSTDASEEDSEADHENIPN